MKPGSKTAIPAVSSVTCFIDFNSMHFLSVGCGFTIVHTVGNFFSLFVYNS